MLVELDTEAAVSSKKEPATVAVTVTSDPTNGCEEAVCAARAWGTTTANVLAPALNTNVEVDDETTVALTRTVDVAPLTTTDDALRVPSPSGVVAALTILPSVTLALATRHVWTTPLLVTTKVWRVGLAAITVPEALVEGDVAKAGAVLTMVAPRMPAATANRRSVWGRTEVVMLLRLERAL
jgi:hypothetical protein